MMTSYLFAEKRGLTNVVSCRCWVFCKMILLQLLCFSDVSVVMHVFCASVMSRVCVCVCLCVCRREDQDGRQDMIVFHKT